MPEPKPLNMKEPCPGCGGQGTFQKAPQLSAAQRAADRRDPNYVPPPPHFDTATLEQIAELGELYRCVGCGMPHREKPKTGKQAESKAE